MKTIIFSFLLSLVSLVGFSQTSFTVTVSGTVTYEDSGNPVVNQPMDIWAGDSIGNPYQNIVFTDNSGYYEDSFSAVGLGSVNVSTPDCAGGVMQTGFYSPSNPTVVLDFNICSDPSGGGDDCEAMFWYYYDSTDLLTLHFMDTSTGNPTSWQWDFGDGGTSSDQNPVHTYAQQGAYLVSLSIASDSCSNTMEQTVLVGDSIPFGDCEAMFFGYPQDGDSVDFLTWQFVDMSIGANGMSPDSWSWDFGDGTYSIEQSPLHTFPEYGSYEVCLTIINAADSCSDTYCEEVRIENDSIGNDCEAWFTYEYGNDSAGINSVSFQAFTSSQYPTDFTWDFGDGNTGAGQTITHNYTQGGLYEVWLSAADSTGCSSNYVDWVWVGDTSSFSISGHVFLADSAMADDATVYLMTFDTLNNGLVSINQTQIQNDVGLYEFTGVGLEHCIYFVQAELNSGSAYYGNYVPTYHLDAVNWEEAWPIFPFFPSGYTYDIVMQPSTNSPSGNGMISGVINSNESRGMLSNVEILLLNQNNVPLEYTRTDNNGNFTFEHLGYGTYVVYTEIAGIKTTPGQVTLSSSNPAAEVTVVVANGKAVMGMEENSAFVQEVSRVYPNPAGNKASVDINVKNSSSISLEIVNYYGQVLQNNTYKLSTGSHRLQLNLANLASGIYFVKIIPQDRASIVRKFVKTK